MNNISEMFMKIPTNSFPSETTLLLSTKVLSFFYIRTHFIRTSKLRMVKKKEQIKNKNKLGSSSVRNKNIYHKIHLEGISNLL